MMRVQAKRFDTAAKDSVGLKTFGIGHLVTKKDPEYGKPVGFKVSRERCESVFMKDTIKHLKQAKNIYDNFDELPEEVQLIVADMTFNLGQGGLAAFKGMKRGVMAKDYNEAANQMVDSKWCRQVKTRCTNLVTRMRALGKC